jgi:hypothetical protein
MPVPELPVAVIGAGWMGHVHARSYARAVQHWPDLPLRPRVVAVAEAVPSAAQAFAAAHGDVAVHEDWRAVLADPDIAAVSVTAPNFLHREIGVAVAEAGKHLWIEKPVGLARADAEAVARCRGGQWRRWVRRVQLPECAGRRARPPLIADGAIGVPTHARVQLFTDYAAHPGSAPSGGGMPLASRRPRRPRRPRLARRRPARFVLGDVAGLVARTAVHIPNGRCSRRRAHYGLGGRPRAPKSSSVTSRTRTMSSRCCGCTGACSPCCEANRVAVGEQNNYGSRCTAPRG